MEQKIDIDEEAIFEKVSKFLSEKGIKFEATEHEPVRTSEEAALIRKTPLQWGAKTMLINTQDNSKILLIYRANMKVSWKKLRKIKYVGKKARMGTEADVY